MSEMKRAVAQEERERAMQSRFASTVMISASIIAGVRLAREDISTPTPRMLGAISDSVRLAPDYLELCKNSTSHVYFTRAVRLRFHGRLNSSPTRPLSLGDSTSSFRAKGLSLRNI